mmetsp:Transcript_56638/g.104853  ORF Transcript_56638/g.104853 Transcript_56638/m.104853 type:complete len:271 (-) Transcript_56638:72-884(-)
MSVVVLPQPVDKKGASLLLDEVNLAALYAGSQGLYVNQEDGPCYILPPDEQMFGQTKQHSPLRSAPVPAQLPKDEPKIGKRRRKGKLTSRSVREAGITTLMLHHLPPSTAQDELLQNLDVAGFAGLYNIVHIPFTRSSMMSTGYAFINMVDADAAAALVESWDGSLEYSTDGSPGSGLFFTAAEVQGYDANIRQIMHKKLHRVRDPRLRPFLAESGGGRLRSPQAGAASMLGFATAPQQQIEVMPSDGSLAEYQMDIGQGGMTYVTTIRL